MKSLENFLRENSKNSVALIHMGQLKSKDVARLIDEHANIYILASYANTFAVQMNCQPWVN